MIKLFEDFKFEIQNPWSKYYQEKYPELKELYNSLELVKFEDEDWVILHHFGSEDAYFPKKDFNQLLKDKIIEKYNFDKNPSWEQLNELLTILNQKSYKKIELSELKDFFQKNKSTYLITNELSKDLGYERFEDFIKEYDTNEVISTGLKTKFFGSGIATSADYQQLPFKVIQFYTNLKDKEKQFAIGKSYFKIQYPLNKLYPAVADPFNFMEGENNPIKNIYNNSKANGFNGTIVRWKEDAYRCDIWEDIDLTYLENGEIKWTKYLLEYTK